MAGRFSGMQTLQELRDPFVRHAWVGRLKFCDGPVSREVKFALCLQLRLVAHVVGDSYSCPECGRLVDTCFSHSSCCANVESTKEHYAVVRIMFERFPEFDTSVVME